MRKTAGSGATGVNLGLIITPMLDMSFQILAFFIMTYHPSALEGHIAGSLAAPHSEHGNGDLDAPILDLGEVNDDAMTVIIKSAGETPRKPGKVLLRRKVEPVPAQIADATDTWVQARRLLDRELRRLHKDADAEKTSIRIEADSELRQAFVIDVYDVCKNAGFSKIFFVPPPR